MAGPELAGGGAPGIPAEWEALARRHYENFPVGSRLLGSQARRHLRRVYAFARTADDLADEAADPAAGRAALDGLEAALLEALAGRPAHPMLAALAGTAAATGLEAVLFRDLIAAFRQDTAKGRYATRSELLDYCRRSADPVGRIVLRVHGIRDPDCDRLSDRVCSGLQVANFLQDVREDFRRRDRIYIPEEDRPGWGEELLREGSATAEFRRSVLDVAAWTRGMFAEGWGLAGRLRGRLRLEVRAVVRSGAAVLDLVEARGGDVLSRPETLRLQGVRRLRVLAAAVLLAGPPASLRRAGHAGR